MVGESAQATAEPQSETAGRLIESSSRWTPGGRRETITASELHAVEQIGFTVLHDVKWPGKRFAKIDHVVIGGGQVWVVSAKKWVGSVTVTGGVLKENGRSRQKYVAEVAEQTQAIASLSPMLPRATFHPILCVEKDDWVNERFGDVWICSSINLVAVVETPPEKGPDYLHNDLVRQLEEAWRDRPPRRRRSSSTRTRPRGQGAQGVAPRAPRLPQEPQDQCAERPERRRHVAQGHRRPRGRRPRGRLGAVLQAEPDHRAGQLHHRLDHRHLLPRRATLRRRRTTSPKKGKKNKNKQQQQQEQPAG